MDGRTNTEEAKVQDVIDMNTAEGIADYLKTLPTENLESIAARPIDSMNFLLVTAASMELIVRNA